MRRGTWVAVALSMAALRAAALAAAGLTAAALAALAPAAGVAEAAGVPGTAGVAEAAGPLDVTGWQWARRIGEGPAGLSPTDGWSVAELDGPALAGVRRDLRDLRIVDEQRQEVPWQELRPPEPALQRFPVRILDLFRDPAGGVTTFVADLGAAGQVTNGIALRTASRDFFKQVTLEAGSDLATWRPLGEPSYIYDLTGRGGGVRLDLAYPDMTHRYLRVTIHDGGTPPLAGLGAELQRLVPPPADEQPVPGRVLARGQDGNDAWSIVDLGWPGFRAVRIRLDVAGTGFHRSVRVEGSDDRAAWHPVQSGAIYRYAGGREQMDLPLDGPAYRFYRVTVLSGNDLPIVPERVTVLARPVRVLFRRPGPGPLFLLYGNPGAAAPAYDPAPFRAAAAGQPAPVTLGPREPVVKLPAAAEPPQPPAQTDADPRWWRFERPLAVPAGAVAAGGGFVEVVLDQQVLAGARPDLADLRLADAAGREVPFELRADRTPPAIEWPFTVANHKAEQWGRWWVLDLGARHAPSEAVRFTATGGNLTRQADIQGSNDGERWFSVGAGTVRRVDTIFGVHESLVVTYPETRARYLRVTVHADTGQVEPAGVTGYLPTLVFRAHSGDTYRLWYGNPAAGARHYPAVLFADAHAPARLGSGALGPEADHNPPPQRPGFLKPGETAPTPTPADPRLTYALWGLLALAVVGLGAAVVRVFRRLGAGTGEGAAGDDSAGTGGPPATPRE